jgi:DNA recombination protein RmuC
MQGILLLIVGVGAGGVLASLGWSKTLSHVRVERDQARSAYGQVQMQTQGLAHELRLERESQERRLGEVEAVFEGMARRVLGELSTEMTRHLGQVGALSDQRLSGWLHSLETTVENYQKGLVAVVRGNDQAMGELRQSTASLLEAQASSQAQSEKLSRLLGRGDQRGRFGELQLENVLAASGLVKGVDYETQVSSRDAAGKLRRPDCVINMGESGGLAIDAKFPYDAFARWNGEEGEQRERSGAAHAAALRAHVRTLGERKYFEVVAGSPLFVICFVPSEAALAVGFEYDPGLYEFAAANKVVLAGPSTLLALLWSVSLVLRLAEQVRGAAELIDLGRSVEERLAVVLQAVAKMGDSLGDSVDQYNRMVASVETRLMPAAKRLSRGADPQAPGNIDRHVNAPRDVRWGAGKLFSEERLEEDGPEGDLVQ